MKYAWGIGVLCITFTSVTRAQDPVPPEPLPPPVAPPPAPLLPEPEAEEESSPFDGLSLGAFVDAYYMKDWNFAADQQAQAAIPHRSFDYSNGFALSFVGVDATYELGSFGLVTALRFGPSTPRHLGALAGIGLENLRQGYAFWRPSDSVQVDLGQFDTPYGAEVPESWRNFNYTRGALFHLMQPFYHTGLRVSAQLSDMFGITGMIVNGVNNPIENNESVDAGLQLRLTPNDDMAFSLGYLISPTGPSSDAINHFIDLVANMSFGDFGLIFNADFATMDTGADTSTYFGVSLAGRYAITDGFAVALRGEYLSDNDGVFYGGLDMDLITATLTLEVVPYAEDPRFVIRLDNKFELASEEIFPKKSADTSDTWFATTLGVVVTTNP